MADKYKHPYRRFYSPHPQIRDAADQYRAAARLLWRQPPGSGVVLPLMQCAAIALELYIKSLWAEDEYDLYEPANPDSGYIVHARAATQGHVLRKLLEALPNEVRAGVTTQYGKSPASTRHPAALDLLDEVDGFFVASRYPYEMNAGLGELNLRLLLAAMEWIGGYVDSLEVREQIIP